jgi:hypothetical protein
VDDMAPPALKRKGIFEARFVVEMCSLTRMFERLKFLCGINLEELFFGFKLWGEH